MLRAACALLMIVLYITGSGKLDLSHNVFHSRDTHVEHLAGQEHDPCHRVIYHGDQKNTCGHSSHISIENHCYACHITHHAFQILPATFTFSSIDYQPIDSIFIVGASSPDIQHTLPSRAPPLRCAIS